MLFLNIIFSVVSFFLAGLSRPDGARFISQNGYQKCIELSNADTRVVLEPNAGGRVLVYSLKGVNVLYINPEQDGWTTEKSAKPPGTHLCAGRFDIGPSKTKPDTDSFFFGRWEADITGPRSARMSKTDSVSGFKLVRDFKLDKNGTHLACKQTVYNIGSENKKICHWSRTFVEGNGICVVPVGKSTRFPNDYIVYNQRNLADVEPVEENVQVLNGLLTIVGPPARPKLEMDAQEGWIAYATRSNRLFIKKFPVYNNKIYGEITGSNTSIWYNGTTMCEVEPIGPWEEIKPGKKVDFTEHWYLAEFPFPENKKLDESVLRNYLKVTK